MDDNITARQDNKLPARKKIKLQLKKRSDNSSLNNLVNDIKKESPIKLSINSNLVNKKSISGAKKTELKIKLDFNTPLNKKVMEEIQIIDKDIPPVQVEKKSEEVAVSFAKPERKVKNISDTIELKINSDSKQPSFTQAFDSIESLNNIKTDKPPVIQSFQVDKEIPNHQSKSNKKLSKIYIITALIILLMLIYYVYTSLDVLLSL